jgi:serine/threonine protein kinase
MINVVGQGGFGRVFKMKHLKSGIMVAVKERLGLDPKLIEAWSEEINVLKMINQKIPTLTTSRFINTLDNEKYILIEWIEGKN